MKSMTGFGYQEYSDETVQITVSLKAYNNKYLDIFTNIPQPFIQLEPRVREYLSQRVGRGRVEFSLSLRELQEDTEIILDKKVVESAVKTLRELMRTAGITEELHLSHLLRMEGILKPSKTRNIDLLWEKILPRLEMAFEDFEKTRVLEGKKTREDIEKQLGIIEESVLFIEGRAGSLEEHFTRTIRDRFTEVMGDLAEESRILAETALLLVRYSINEELVRMKSHIHQFRTSLRENRSVGKGLDFLCQELNREINTIGSKNLLLEVSQRVVQVKEALENIREQVRNVE